MHLNCRGLLTHSFFNKYTVSPQYPWFPDLQIQPKRIMYYVYNLRLVESADVKD